MSTRRFALFLAMTLACLWWPVWAAGEVPGFRDYAWFAQPLASFHRTTLLSGQLPLWNPYNHFGLPFLAQWNTLTLYPGSLLYLLIPGPAGLAFFVIIHQFIAGLALHRLAIRWSESATGASIAGTAFALSQLTFNTTTYPNNLAALAWMPLLIDQFDRTLNTPVHSIALRRHLALASLLCGLQLLTGAPELILATWLLIGGLTLLHGFRQTPSPTPANLPLTHLLSRVFLVTTLGCALAAPQLLPFLRLLLHSQRDASFGDNAWSLPASGLLNLAFPTVHTPQALQGIRLQFGQYWITGCYIGLPILALAFLPKPRNRLRLPLLITMLLSLWLALGDSAGLLAMLRHLIPGLGLIRYPVKFIVPTFFALPLLAALGMASIERFPPPRLRQALATAALLIAGYGAILWERGWPIPSPPQPHTVLTDSVIHIGLTLLTLSLLIRAPRHPTAITLALTLLVIDFSIAFPLTRGFLVPAQVYQPIPATVTPPPSLGRGRLHLAPDAQKSFLRVNLPNPVQTLLLKRQGAFANGNLLDQWPKTDGFFSLIPGRTDDLNRALDRLSLPEHLPLLRFLGITATSRPGRPFEWDPVPQPDPSWLKLVPNARYAPVPRAVLETLIQPGFDPATQLLLEPDTATAPAVNLTTPIPLSRPGVTSTHFTTSSVAADVEIPAGIPGCWLIHLQSWDRGWRVRIDGQPCHNRRADYAFQAVYVPTGRHHVEWSYHEPTALPSILLLACGLGTCLWLLRRTKPTPES